jgi:DNA-binding LacI/PurR family transcriptional regulator
VTGRCGLIEFIVPDFVHHFFAEVTPELAIALGKKGYYLTITSKEKRELALHEIDQLVGRGLNVLILASSNPNIEALDRIEGCGTACILYSRSSQQLGERHWSGRCECRHLSH